MSNLKRGYTTGVHTLFAFKSSLEVFLSTKIKAISKTNKMDNDDLDVTKGCEIVVEISWQNDFNLNKTSHLPHIFTHNSNSIKIYAGRGVGVVTKRGLKIAPSYPAINPTPLKALEECFKKLTNTKENLELFCAISVTDGEKLAKQTANEKVGVLGGISILGTSGFVKPVSSIAYLNSIEVEIKFALANGYEKLVFTLGNSAYIEAKEQFNEEQIIEIGNFVYDAINILKSEKVKIIFICGVGKMTKVAQGFKNTHNKFGEIDFKLLQEWVDIDISGIVTVKGVCEELKDVDSFYESINQKATKNIKSWFRDIDIECKILEYEKLNGV